MTATHIVSSFTEDMNQLQDYLIEMGTRVEKQLENAMLALSTDDLALAKTVTKGDQRINKLEAQLNDIAVKILALRQPVAIDLRVVIMSLKMARHLERTGDYAKDIARRTKTISKADAFSGSFTTLIRMGEMVQGMIRMSMEAYKHKDAVMADKIRANDEHVDHLHNTLFRELLTYMMEDPRNISGAIHILMMARHLERMGDHAADIAKETMYMVSGEWPEDKRNKEDNTSKMIVEMTDDVSDG